MASIYELDPVSGIPDPPQDESAILEWARNLTESLQRDHISSVNRAETQMMSEPDTSNRPAAEGSRRFFYDEKTGTLYLDVENAESLAEWKNINNEVTYSRDGIGVYVIYSSSLPYSAGTSGSFSFDEEVWDKAAYWAPGAPTNIEIPTTRKYEVLFVATIDNLATDEELVVYVEVDGESTKFTANESDRATSEGAGEEYELKLSYYKDLEDVNTLVFKWESTATFDMSECYAIVTPVTESGGGGSTPDSSITEHGLLTGLTADDHEQYLRYIDAEASRAIFSTKWDDLTDAGETQLHYHKYFLDDMFAVVNKGLYWGATQVLTLNGSGQIVMGNNANEVVLGADDFNLVDVGNTDFDLGGTFDIDTVGLMTVQTNAGGLSLNAVGGNIVLTTTASSSFIALDSFNSVAIRPGVGDNIDVERNPCYLRIDGNSGTLRNVVGKDGSNRTVLGWAGAHDVAILTTTMVDVSGGEKVRLPYTAAGSPPSNLANGDMWMEADGLHIYWGGADKLVTGV